MTNMQNALNSVLALDMAGNPSGWICIEEAVHLLVTDRVLAALGSESRVLSGGINAASGLQSSIEVSSILLTRGRVHARLFSRHYEPPLTNRALFARDGRLCLYCGQPFNLAELTRDHVIPSSRGGQDVWTNVATACRRCNHFKGARTPTEAGMDLLAVPYAPCHAEHLILQNRHVLGDQLAFLKARVKRRRSS